MHEQHSNQLAEVGTQLEGIWVHLDPPPPPPPPLPLIILLFLLGLFVDDAQKGEKIVFFLVFFFVLNY